MHSIRTPTTPNMILPCPEEMLPGGRRFQVFAGFRIVQREKEVERMVRNVRGVNGVINDVTVTPPAAPERVAAQIEEAFEREAEVDARHVRVEVSDHTARLYGHVHSANEANAAAVAAAAAPGVAKVENHLVVSP